jgi:hypothetical protein
MRQSPPKPIVVMIKLMVVEMPKALKVVLMTLGLKANTINISGLVTAPMQANNISKPGES